MQPEKDLRYRDHRQIEGVVGGVAEHPVLQRVVAMEHVPGLQCIVRPVRVHWMTERDPQGKGGQGQPAADPRSDGPPAPRRGTGTHRGIYLPGGALAWRRRRSLRAGHVGKTRLLLASIHTWTLLRTSHASWPSAGGGSNGRPAAIGSGP